MISHAGHRASTRIVRSGIAAVACLILGCGGAVREPGVIVLASGADLESANPLVTVHPLSRQIQRYALFVTLTRLDDSLRQVPYFARSWRWSRDSTSMTMVLSRALRWHDGRSVTADDVAFTVLAARDPVTGFARSSELAALDTIRALDEHTVEFRYRGSQPTLNALFAELPILPAHLLASVPRAKFRGAAFNTSPVGSGPFRFASRAAGARWTFVRNPDFPAELGGPPAAAGLVVAVVDEATTKFAALASGEVDMAGIAPTMAQLATEDATLRVLSYPVNFSVALCFNTTRAPTDDSRVRRAISLALDRNRIVQIALAGFGEPSANVLGAARAPLPDAHAADSLLDAAGWVRDATGLRRRGGLPLELELLTVGSGENVVEQLIQSDLGALGITVRIRQTEMGAFLSAARANPRTYDMLLAGIPGDLQHSELRAMFASSQRGGALDYTGFHTLVLDSLLQARAVAGTTSPGATAGDAALSSYLDSLAPATWLYRARGVQGLSRRLHGVRMDLRGELVTIHDWTLQVP